MGTTDKITNAEKSTIMKLVNELCAYKVFKNVSPEALYNALKKLVLASKVAK